MTRWWVIRLNLAIPDSEVCARLCTQVLGSSIELKRPSEGQFQVNFMALRSYPEEFYKYYRMTITSFDVLFSLVQKDLTKQLTCLRVPISPEERLTVTLRYLATGTNFSALHFDFVMGVSTISNIINETCDILWKILQPREMSVPTTEDWLQISKSFYEKTQFPNCVGAVDGKHVRLECPKNSGSQLLMLAPMVKRAIAMYLKNLYADKVNFPPEHVLPGDEEGIPQPYVIVGDKAFALNKHLLRPFPGKSLNYQRRVFNYRLSRARQNIECTFGILSNKWRIFHTPILVSPDFAVKITICVLHNFVRRRDGFSAEDTFSYKLEDYSTKKGVGNASSEAKEVREYFVDYINSPGNILSWQNKVIG